MAASMARSTPGTPTLANMRAAAWFGALLVLASCLACEPRSTTPKSATSTQAAPPLFARSRPLMGTVFRIEVDAPPSVAERAVRDAFDEIERLEHVLSEWLPNSEISQVNQGAGRKKVAVGAEVFEVVKAGIDVSRWSGGAFDLSWAALRGLYDFSSETPKIPNAKDLKSRLRLVNWKWVTAQAESRTVNLKKRGMAIGTGAIAKGYALDRAGAVLRGAGIDNYMIFGGGQVQVQGRRGDRGWRVGIQHPRDPNAYFGAIESDAASFSTSGDYENAFIDQSGKRWHHIIDTKDGYPADKSMSVTVIAPLGLYADALSTAAFVMGPEAAITMLSSLPFPADAVIVGADCKLYTTKGGQARLHLHVELSNGRLPNCTPTK